MLLLFLPLTMILEPKLPDKNSDALWDVDTVGLWDPLGIGKQPQEDWAGFVGLTGLTAMESNYMAAPGGMVGPSQCLSFYSRHEDCFAVYSFYFNLALSSLLPYLNVEHVEAFPARGGLLLSYPKEDSVNCVKYFGLPRKQKTSLDSSESGNILTDHGEGCCQALLR